MTTKAETELAAIGTSLRADAHAAWVTAEMACSDALRVWFESPGVDRAYDTYLAALDREQAAALDLERLWASADSCPRACP